MNIVYVVHAIFLFDFCISYLRGWTGGRPSPPLRPLTSPSRPLSPSSPLGAAHEARAQNFPLFPSLPFSPIFLPSPSSRLLFSSPPLFSLPPDPHLPLPAPSFFKFYGRLRLFRSVLRANFPCV